MRTQNFQEWGRETKAETGGTQDTKHTKSYLPSYALTKAPSTLTKGGKGRVHTACSLEKEQITQLKL